MMHQRAVIPAEIASLGAQTSYQSWLFPGNGLTSWHFRGKASQKLGRGLFSQGMVSEKVLEKVLEGLHRTLSRWPTLQTEPQDIAQDSRSSYFAPHPLPSPHPLKTICQAPAASTRLSSSGSSLKKGLCSCSCWWTKFSMSTSKLAEVMHSEPCVACSHFSKSRVSSGNSGCLQKTKETSHNAHWFRSPVRFYPTPSIQSLPVCKSPVVQTSLPSQCWKCALETSSNNRKKRLEIAKFTIFSTRQWLLPTSWCCPSLHHKVFQDISRYFKIFQDICHWQKGSALGWLSWSHLLSSWLCIPGMDISTRSSMAIFYLEMSLSVGGAGWGWDFYVPTASFGPAFLQVAPPPRGLFAPWSSTSISTRRIKGGSDLTSFLP